MNSQYINGTVMRMELRDAEVNNNGTIMHLSGNNITVRNYGTIMHGGSCEQKIVYRDRIRYAADPEAQARLRQATEELEYTKKRLSKANSENAKLRQRIVELEAQRTQSELINDLQEKLELVMKANRAASLRIRELERGVCDTYLREQIDPWDIKPTKEQCARLLRCMESFIEANEE